MKMENSEKYSRTAEILKNSEAINKIKQTSVAIFGLGGVGGYVCECLARSGIENFVLIDNDIVSLSNINRQIIALETNLGQKKTELWKQRILEINKDAKVITANQFIKDSIDCEEISNCNYICDCIDSVEGKTTIAKYAKEHDIALISCCGTGRRLDPTKLQIVDINQTHDDPLAKSFRKELKEKNIKDVTVVFSNEKPIVSKGKVVGSMVFVPASAGILMANHIIKSIIGGN